MLQLVISKIMVFGGVRIMECTVLGLADFIKHPDFIYFLGTCFHKSHWSSKHKVVYYHTH